MRIENALEKHEAELLRLANVTGVGIGDKNGKEVILVFVSQKLPLSKLNKSDVVPEKLDGFETDVRLQIKVD